VASLYKKVVGGKPYWYLREMARVGGKPKMVSERYVGSAADIAALLDEREEAVVPQRTRHLAFGDVAAAWETARRLGVVEVIDEVVGARRGDAAASIGTYLTLAAINRLADPRSKLGFADWWKTTAADRFTRIPAAALDHRKFWDAMHGISLEGLVVVEQRLVARMVELFDLDISALALDMTNFATYIDSGNDRAPIAQRGKAKQKRTDLRLVGLGLAVTRDGGIPLVSHGYPGNRPDVTQFAAMIDLLVARHTAAAGVSPAEITVVFDAGQNSTANFTHLTESGPAYVGSVPPSDCADLLSEPATGRVIVDADRFDGLSALQTRREVYGQVRRTILTHSSTPHTAQSRGFDQTTAKAEAKLAALADTLARGKTRRGRTKVTAEIDTILKDPWLRRVTIWDLTGDTPADHRLTWHIDNTTRADLKTEIFGKRVLITDREDWPISEVVAAYRSQSDAEFAFRQMKDPHVVSFSPMRHWTEHNIRVHLFTCVLALQLAHLMRREAKHAGLDMSVRDLLDHLAGIQETVLIYPSTGGRPKARRMLTETNPTQDTLIDILNLTQHAPRS